MTGPDRIIITPQGGGDLQTEEHPVDLLRTVTWLVLAGSLVGDLALAFQQAATSLRLGFALVTAVCALALAVQPARR